MPFSYICLCRMGIWTNVCVCVCVCVYLSTLRITVWCCDH